jgi:hypothetical protein
MSRIRLCPDDYDEFDKVTGRLWDLIATTIIAIAITHRTTPA